MSTVAADAAGRPRPRGTSTLTGLPVTTRLAARSGRWFWLIWVLALASSFSATAGAYSTLFPPGTPDAVINTLGENVTMRAMLGPPYDLLHVGGFTMFRVGTFVATMAGVMAALGVIRATRAEEEDGRSELLRAGAIGRHAPLAGAVAVGLGACLLLGLLTTVIMRRATPELAGAVVMGLGMALTGAVFVGVGAVAAQLSESARASRGIAMGAVGAAYLLRAYADGRLTEGGVANLRWLSPVEWAALARPYADERWWVLLLPAALTAVLIAVAFAMENRRDHGAGLRATRLGRPEASPALSSAEGLAWRLHRGSIVGWGVGLAVFGLVSASLANVFDSPLEGSESLAERFRRMGGGAQDLHEAFYVAMLGIVVSLVALFGVQLLGRLRREETLGHAEVMLATATSRVRYALSHLVPALLVPTVLFAACAALFTLPKLGSDGFGPMGQLVGAALALCPGVWLVVGFAMLLHGWAPRLLVLPWAVIGWTVFVQWVGAYLNLPKTLLDASPFAPLPQLPVDPMAWTPVLVETLLAVALCVAGLVGYARRDIPTT